MQEVYRVSELGGIDLRDKAKDLIIKWIRQGFRYIEISGKKNPRVRLCKSSPYAEDDFSRQRLNSTITWSELEFFLKEVKTFVVYG